MVRISRVKIKNAAGNLSQTEARKPNCTPRLGYKLFRMFTIHNNASAAAKPG
jgi:hypothetical protein